MPGSPIPVETRGRIHAMRHRGMSYSEIARETGVPISSVHRIASQPTDGAERIKPNGDILVVLTAEEAGRLNGQEALAVAAGLLAEKDQRAKASLKARVLKAVCESGPFPDSRALMALIQNSSDNWSHHELVSALHQLRKQGMVKFRVDKRPSGGRSIGTLGGGDPVHIEATRAAGVNGVSRDLTMAPGDSKAAEPERPRPQELENRTTGTHPAGYSRAKHAAGKDYTEPRYHGTRANGGPVQRIKVKAPEILPAVAEAAPEPQPSPEGWPLLTELLARFRENAERDAKASKYAEAAAALEAIDPVRSEELMALALEAGGKPFSPVEIEYLRFAEKHRG